GLPALTLISADEELNIAAQAEGLIVEEPNTHCTERPALASRCPTTLSASPLLASRRKPGARLTPSLGAIRPKRWRGRRSGALVRPNADQERRGCASRLLYPLARSRTVRSQAGTSLLAGHTHATRYTLAHHCAGRLRA